MRMNIKVDLRLENFLFGRITDKNILNADIK